MPAPSRFAILNLDFIKSIDYTRRGFGGRGPLCGTGVSSAMRETSIPLPANPRSADSRPAPTPRITTSTSLTPMIAALSPTSSPTLAAANGVPFFAPEKPSAPEDDHAIALPFLSVSRTFVLLYVAWIWSVPDTMFFFATRARERDFNPWSTVPPDFLMIRFFPIHHVFSSLRRPLVIVLRMLPRTVREFVLVPCPRAGRCLAWREPRYDLMSFKRRMLPLISRRSSPSTMNFSIASRRAVSSLGLRSFGRLPASIPKSSSVFFARGRPTP